MATSSLRVQIGPSSEGGANKKVEVPSHARDAVRNLMARTKGAFQFASEAALLGFTNRKIVPPELLQMVPEGEDAWSFFTAPLAAELPPPRRPATQLAWA